MSQEPASPLIGVDELAARLRDEIQDLKKELRAMRAAD